MAREGAAPSARLSYLVEHYLRAPLRDVVAAVRSAQKAGLIATDVRPELVLFLILGAGSHLFDVIALARESVGLGGIFREGSAAPTSPPRPAGSRRR